jgi:hypothetical protein
VAAVDMEIVVCADCAIVIANGDTSGLEDPEAHLARMDATLPADGHVVITCTGETCDTGPFRTDTCGACGAYITTDQWHDAAILKD